MAGWVSVKSWSNDAGKTETGIFRKNYKKTVDTIYVSNSHRLIRYKYPNCEIPFQSKMHRWENLYFCGGFDSLKKGEYVGSGLNCVKAVLDGLKPVCLGVVVGEKDINEYMEMIEPKGLVYVVRDHPRLIGSKVIDVANAGKISDLFNIDDLIESYRLCGIFLDDNEEKKLREKTNRQLSDYLQGYDYANPVEIQEVILTGLILGYPVESTVAVLYKNVY